MAVEVNTTGNGVESVAMGVHFASGELQNGRRRGWYRGASCVTLGLAALCLAGSSPPHSTSRPATVHRDDPVGSRTDHADTLERFGGTRETERAVAEGLAWLAAHQRGDGVWDRCGFPRLCPAKDQCSQAALNRLDKSADVGVSALAVLAFLGAGHTHQRGPYKDTITKAFDFILAQQRSDGSFSRGSGLQIYDDAVATLAAAEAYAMTGDRVFAGPLKRAVRHLEQAQQEGGGWDYTDEPTGRCDTSVTGWVLMALKSAQGAGVPVSLETRLRIIEHFDRATDSDGRVWYANKGAGVETDPGGGVQSRRYGPGMAAVGLYARTALGLRLDDAVARRQIELLTKDPPNLNRMYRDKTSLHSEYYWYYGTLAMFNLGGREWERWNAALRSSVLEYQERPRRRDGSRKHAYGSWPAFGADWGQWGRTGSRIYSTALNTLTLEIYYRYTPAYMSPRTLIGPAEVRREIGRADPEGQARLLRFVMRLQADIAEPLLLEFLASNRSESRLEAALELARLGSPRGEAELRRRLERGPADQAERIRRRLAELDRRPRQFECGRVTEVDEATGMFLFETAGQVLYYGQKVTVLRGGRPTATALVSRRFSSQQAAAAKLDHGGAAVGDLVTTKRVEQDGRTDSG